LSESEIVVGAHVQSLRGGACELERQVEVVALPVQKRDETAWDASHWAPEAVIDAQLQTTNVEVVEIAVQGCVSVSFLELLVPILLETLAEKVPHMSKNDQNQVGDVGCDQVVVGRLILYWLWKLLANKS
jgi:hypothetical protein